MICYTYTLFIYVLCILLVIKILCYRKATLIPSNKIIKCKFWFLCMEISKYQNFPEITFAHLFLSEYKTGQVGPLISPCLRAWISNGEEGKERGGGHDTLLVWNLKPVRLYSWTSRPTSPQYLLASVHPAPLHCKKLEPHEKWGTSGQKEFLKWDLMMPVLKPR